MIKCREEGGKAGKLRQERAPLAGRRFAGGRALPFGARRVICSPARGARYSRGAQRPSERRREPERGWYRGTEFRPDSRQNCVGRFYFQKSFPI